MSRFTSARERRLWFWALAVLLAIYSTIPLAGPLGECASDPRCRRALEMGMFYTFVALVVVVVVYALVRRPERRETWVTLGVAAIAVMTLIRWSVGPAVRSHLMECGLLAILVHEALIERARNGRPVPHPAWSAILLTSSLGVVDELVQIAVPDRVYDPIDMGTNVLAAVVAVSATLVLARLRRLVLRESGRR